MKAFVLAATAMTAVLVTPAFAATLNLVPIIGNTVGPQSSVTTGIIAGTNFGSQIATMGYNETTANQGNFNRYSTQAAPGVGVDVPEGVQGTPYTAGQLVTATGGVQFDIGIDVNTTGNPTEELVLFQLINYTTQAVLYEFSNPNGASITDNQNGNGFADYRLNSVNLVGLGLTASSELIFHAVWTGGVDGAESFFLFNGRGGTVINPTGDPPGAVPLPAAAWLFMTGLAGLGMLARRRKKQTA